MLCALEHENGRLRDALLEASICMQHLGLTLQTSHMELLESCKALCEDNQQDATHQNRDKVMVTSQRQLALYLAFLRRASDLAHEQASAAQSIGSQIKGAAQSNVVSADSGAEHPKVASSSQATTPNRDPNVAPCHSRSSSWLTSLASRRSACLIRMVLSLLPRIATRSSTRSASRWSQAATVAPEMDFR